MVLIGLVAVGVGLAIDARAKRRRAEEEEHRRIKQDEEHGSSLSMYHNVGVY